MTKNEIQNMPAGREMDALIAEMVMGLKVDYEFDEPHVPSLRDKYDEWGYLPNYSTDIAAAWEVVEKLHDFEINRRHVYWLCSFKGNEPMQGDTAPLAICRAALLDLLVTMP